MLNMDNLYMLVSRPNWNGHDVATGSTIMAGCKIRPGELQAYWNTWFITKRNHVSNNGETWPALSQTF